MTGNPSIMRGNCLSCGVRDVDLEQHHLDNHSDTGSDGEVSV